MSLKLEQRYKLQVLREAKVPPRHIATLLGIHKFTVYREINRGGGPLRYDPETSQERAETLASTSHRHCTYGENDWKAVDEKIREDLSSDQVNGRMKLDGMGVPGVTTNTGT